MSLNVGVRVGERGGAGCGFGGGRWAGLRDGAGLPLLLGLHREKLHVCSLPLLELGGGELGLGQQLVNRCYLPFPVLLERTKRAAEGGRYRRTL